jgi:siroheme synthase (precorrin-2 oxidase/ferrochelatase)
MPFAIVRTNSVKLTLAVKCEKRQCLVNQAEDDRNKVDYNAPTKKSQKVLCVLVFSGLRGIVDAIYLEDEIRNCCSCAHEEDNDQLFRFMFDLFSESNIRWLVSSDF